MTKKIRNLFFLLFLLGQVLFAKEEKDSLFSESLSAKKLNVELYFRGGAHPKCLIVRSRVEALV